MDRWMQSLLHDGQCPREKDFACILYTIVKTLYKVLNLLWVAHKACYEIQG
jgi:hypothetical protein